MSRPVGESDFITILDCEEGKVFYKFNEDGVWKHDHKQPSVKMEKPASALGVGDPGAAERSWNVIEANRYYYQGNLRILELLLNLKRIFPGRQEYMYLYATSIAQLK